MQANRLFEILYLLLNKKRVTAKELAERFEVSTRTIYRDIDTISSAGIPIYTEKGRDGGISLLPDFTLSKSILNEKEQQEILAALLGLTKIHATETDAVLQKLSAVFNKSATDWLEVDFSNWDFNNEDLFENLKHAILNQQIIEFEYFSSYSERSYRQVEPIQLWFKSKAWYLKAFCLTRQSMRLFKLTRMKNVSRTETKFENRGVDHLISEEQPSEEKIKNIRLVLKIAPELGFRVLDDFSLDEFEEQEDGSFLISVIWPEGNWLYYTILSYGEHAQIIEPEHVRNIVKEKAKKIWEQP